MYMNSRFLFFLLVFAFLNNLVLSQTTYYSKAGESNPNLLSNWTLNSDGTGGNPGAFSGDNLIFVIQNGHNYTTTAAWGITGASTLQVDGTITFSHVVTLGNGSNIGNLTVNGTVQANVQNVIANTSGVFTINSGGKYVLNHSTASNGTTTFNGTETFNSGSTFEYQNLSAGGFVSSVTYHHLILNASITQSFPATITINGDLTVTQGTITVSKDQTVNNLTVNGGNLILNNGSTSRTFTINGNAVISGGSLKITGPLSTANNICTISGNLTISGGTLTTTDVETTSTLNLYGNITMSSGAFNKTSGAGTSYIKLLKASGTQIISLSSSLSYAHVWTVGDGATTTNTLQLLSNIGIGGVSSFNVKSGATLDCQTYLITGTSATFNAESGSNVKTAHAEGLSTTATTGSIQVTGSKTYNSAASYTYNGSSAQVIGNGLTGANNLTIDNTSGVTLSASLSVSGALNLTNGRLTLDTYNLTLGASSTIGGTPSSRMLQGKKTLKNYINN